MTYRTEQIGTGTFLDWTSLQGLSEVVATERLAAVLAPLLHHLMAYDAYLRRMRQRGGTVADLRALGRMLKREVLLDLPHEGKVKTSLVDPCALRRRLTALASGIRLDIRTGAHGFPTHYLYRTSTDYFGTFTLVLEDYFRSSGFDAYESPWDPVVTTTRHGAVQRVLRLSPYRAAAEGVCSEFSKRSEETRTSQVFGLFGGDRASHPTPDQLLYDAGRHVLDAAWHDDQRLAFATCSLLDMPGFRRALELVYLCLGGDLTRLRAVGGTRRGEAMKAFFRYGYEQPAFVSLINRLVRGEGAVVSRYRKQAGETYRQLARMFSELMNIGEGMAGFPGSPPLYKIILGNYRRVDGLRPMLGPELVSAGSTTDAEADDLAAELLAV